MCMLAQYQGYAGGREVQVGSVSYLVNAYGKDSSELSNGDPVYLQIRYIDSASASDVEIPAQVPGWRYTWEKFNVVEVRGVVSSWSTYDMDYQTRMPRPEMIARLTFPSSVTNVTSFAGCENLTNVVFCNGLKGISHFNNCPLLDNVELPDGLETIGYGAFANCPSLRHLTIPASVKFIQSGGGGYSPAFENLTNTCITLAPGNTAYKMLDGSIYSMDGTTHIWTPSVSVEVISTTLRTSDPTIMDVKYIVRGGYETVDVRALAFKDGIRSWANVVRPESFVNTADGLPSVLGDALTLNEEHSFSWKVSDDYSEPLAKFQIEIFVRPESLLPMDFTTIPQSGTQPALEVSSNPQTQTDVMNALYWLYADKTTGLTLNNGVLSASGEQLAVGAGFEDGGTPLDPSDDGANAAKYVIGKMGYGCLSVENHLERVNRVTRLGLAPKGLLQYAVKELVP